MARGARRSLIRRLFTRKAGSDPEEAGRSESLDVMIAIVLGAAAILTAWGAYQAALSDGNTLAGFQEGNAQYGDANQAYIEGYQQESSDLILFKDYALAKQKGDKKAATFIYDDLMDGTLPKATDQWEADPEGIPSAFEAPAYKIEPYERAKAATAEGDKQYEIASVEDKKGDKYTLATVILAVALFFGGVAGVTRSHLISVMTVVTSAVLVVGSGIYMLTL
jgi:hypothetical protein